MTKLIKGWKELAAVPASDKYKIIVDQEMCSGWIVPVCDEFDENRDFICNCPDRDTMNTYEYFNHHIYLSTHTFYGSRYAEYTKVLQECGFDIELDNWDKDRK